MGSPAASSEKPPSGDLRWLQVYIMYGAPRR